MNHAGGVRAFRHSVETRRQASKHTTQSLRDATGIQFANDWVLVNHPTNDPEILRAVTALLDEDLEAKALEGLVRSLAVAAARGIANERMLQLLEFSLDRQFAYGDPLPPDATEAHAGMQWVIGNTLAAIARPPDGPQLARTLLDERLLEPARRAYPDALRLADCAEVRESLWVMARRSETASPFAVFALARLGDYATVPLLEVLSADERRHIRDRAAGWLTRLNHAAS